MALNNRPAFAVWITGLPASGKSTLAAAVKAQLAARGVDVAVLESDELRKIFTPEPHYDERERDAFYRQMVYIGVLLTSHGVTVLFDATANRRAYRQMARGQIPRFLEVYVDTPLETCLARDPKGIYRQARGGEAPSYSWRSRKPRSSSHEANRQTDRKRIFVVRWAAADGSPRTARAQRSRKRPGSRPTFIRGMATAASG